MRKLIIIHVLLSLLLFNACSGNSRNPKEKNSSIRNIPVSEEKTTAAKNTHAQATNLTYIIDSIRIKWMGFKYTNKTGVPGTFNKVTWKNLKEAKTPEKTLQGASFTINVKSLDTGNPGRNKTIIEYLFGKMMETNRIEGRIAAIEPDNALIKVALRLNNHEKIAGFRYIINENILKAKSKIDLIEDFKAAEPFYFLHTACEDKHTGKDGISKTWPDVSLEALIYFHNKSS